MLKSSASVEIVDCDYFIVTWFSSNLFKLVDLGAKKMKQQNSKERAQNAWKCICKRLEVQNFPGPP